MTGGIAVGWRPVLSVRVCQGSGFWDLAGICLKDPGSGLGTVRQLVSCQASGVGFVGLFGGVGDAVVSRKPRRAISKGASASTRKSVAALTMAVRSSGLVVVRRICRPRAKPAPW